jgi:hypothetical protein
MKKGTAGLQFTHVAHVAPSIRKGASELVSRQCPASFTWQVDLYVRHKQLHAWLKWV